MKKIIWILLDNRIGSRHQAEGVANYLDTSKFNIAFKEIEYTKWAALPNFLRANTLLGLTTKSKSILSAPWPDVVLSSSRRTAPVARWLKKQNAQTQLIQLLHIGFWGSKDFTTIYVPEHDKYKINLKNIKYTIGSPHFITPEKLSAAKKLWQTEFSALPHPITAVIIGGAIKKHSFSLQNAETLANKIKALKLKEGGSLLITTSRRTGPKAEKKIMSILEDFPHYSYLWGDNKPNPYLGFLACADNIIVTGDSVSMCCEATATEKPLQIFTGKDWLSAKHLRFVQSLINNNYASLLSENKTAVFPKSKLNIAEDIAKEINEL
ncbi:MAG: mitochondrial fission ELM1 family protein [Alphaproteobacteria bacterium]|nr:mitochondrial fission ELM1 family protein [Alphaproteobacteria bacterium]